MLGWAFEQEGAGKKKGTFVDRFSLLIFRSAADSVGVRSDGRPLRRLFERSSSPVSSIWASHSAQCYLGYAEPTPYRSAIGPETPSGIRLLPVGRDSDSAISTAMA